MGSSSALGGASGPTFVDGLRRLNEGVVVELPADILVGNRQSNKRSQSDQRNTSLFVTSEEMPQQWSLELEPSLH
jgi:hypothetical protein